MPIFLVHRFGLRLGRSHSVCGAGDSTLLVELAVAQADVKHDFVIGLSLGISVPC